MAESTVEQATPPMQILPPSLRWISPIIGVGMFAGLAVAMATFAQMGYLLALGVEMTWDTPPHLMVVVAAASILMLVAAACLSAAMLWRECGGHRWWVIGGYVAFIAVSLLTSPGVGSLLGGVFVGLLLAATFLARADDGALRSSIRWGWWLIAAISWCTITSMWAGGRLTHRDEWPVIQSGNLVITQSTGGTHLCLTLDRQSGIVGPDYLLLTDEDLRGKRIRVERIGPLKVAGRTRPLRVTTAE